MNIAAAQAGSRHRFRTKDFLLEFEDETDKPAATAPEAPRKRVYTQTWQEQKLIGMMYAAAFNQEEERKQKKRR